MKSATAVLALLTGFAIATPVQKRQDIDFDAYDAVPDVPAVAAPAGDDIPTAVVEYVPAAAAASAIADIVPTVGKRLADPTPPGCSVWVTSNYAGVVAVDSPDGFRADAGIAAIATAAKAPVGYFPVAGFTNLKASAENPSYQTYIASQLDSYDVNKCAAFCTNNPGCTAFNIYFERDNHYNSDKDACPASATVSATLIKCAFYGAPLTLSQAKNDGQITAAGFEIAIAGSNAYTTNPQPISAFDGPYDFGNAAISVTNGANTYQTVDTFSAAVPYNPAVCAAACTELTAYNQRHKNAITGAYRTCNFFDAYILSKNGINGQFTCTYYTVPYDVSWATNHGQTRGSDVYTISHSYGYKVAGVPFAPSKGS